MEYLDGEGTAASRGEIAAHLASCADCQEVAAEQRRISDHARAWTRAPGSGVTAGAGPAGWSFRRNPHHAPPGALDARRARRRRPRFCSSLRSTRNGATCAQRRPSRRSLSRTRGPGRCPCRRLWAHRGIRSAGWRPQSNLPNRPLPRPPMCHRARVRRRSSGLRGCRSSSRTSVRCAARSKRWSRRPTDFIDHMTVTGDTSDGRAPFAARCECPGIGWPTRWRACAACRPGRGRHAGIAGRHRSDRRSRRAPGERPRDRTAPDGTAAQPDRPAVRRPGGRTRAHPRPARHRTARRGEDQRRPPRQLRDDRHHDQRGTKGRASTARCRSRPASASRPPTASRPHSKASRQCCCSRSEWARCLLFWGAVCRCSVSLSFPPPKPRDHGFTDTQGFGMNSCS